MNNKVTLIDLTCYLYPHREELVWSSPYMQGMWLTCKALLKEYDNAFIAPILLDDIQREGSSIHQNLSDIIPRYERYPMFGKPVLESQIEKQYGNLGCKIYDSIYHRDVISSVISIYQEWTWVVPIPIAFQDQQSGMLEDLWKWMKKNVDWSAIASREHMRIEDLHAEKRDNFLAHFLHYWIDGNGEVMYSSRPVFKNGKVQHAVIENFAPIGAVTVMEIV